ncbi:MAG: alanine--tRNA ligase [Pirellulales bacterium]
MKTDELRQLYLDFYVSKGHTLCASDVLVPTWDASVLFTPAGMNPFKDHFLGKVKLEFTRATSCQKCLRTGDIENVGRTAYHHTFFEMLGNFSFGDYFKREAINWAWEFLTDKKWLGLDADRLSVTVYKDDDEAAKIWATDVKLPQSRIQRMDEDENFWPASAPSQGPDGVCGPCSEIYYHPPGGQEVEIWNLVFTQFNRVGDPPDNLRPLPSKNIDTGMGLERTAATLQGVDTNYHIDILKPIVLAAAEICGREYDPKSEDGRRLRRITDHVRACTFAIHENVYPGANKEKYVVKRLLRRAVLDGHQMGLRDPFLHQLVPAVVAAMRTPYPELSETAARVAEGIKNEEANFFGTIDDGLARIGKIFKQMESNSRLVVDGGDAAELYTTYGVPPELFANLAAEKNLAFDWDGFRLRMDEHGDISGGGRMALFGDDAVESLKKAHKHTKFVGYERTETAAELLGIVAQNSLCDELDEIGHQQPVIVVLDATPFYAESGGQVGDSGWIVGEKFKFEVTDTQKNGDLVLHFGHLREGHMTAGDGVTATVDADRRDAIRRAHSATHILHHALQKNLGAHAQQQGSKVERDLLRFDFTNQGAVPQETLEKIEAEVRGRISVGDAITAEVVPLADARQAGAMMLFGEKYPDPVRMISMGDFSKELCGGTHLPNTKDVGQFEVISEESVSAGTRRIVALTGTLAKEHADKTEFVLSEVAALLKVEPTQVPAAIDALSRYARALKKEVNTGEAAGDSPRLQDAAHDHRAHKLLLRETAAALKVSPFDVPERIESLVAEIEHLGAQLAQRRASDGVTPESLLAAAEEIDGVRVVVAEAVGSNPNMMRQMIDRLRKEASPVAVFLGCGQGEDKVMLVAGVSRDLEERGVDSGRWVRESAAIVGGSGGGKPSLAQAGGKHPEKLPEALAQARETIRAMLAR